MHYLFILLSFTLIGTALYANEGIPFLIDPLALLLVLTIPLLLLGVSHDRNDAKRFIRYWLHAKADNASKKLIQLLKNYITYTYATALLLVLMGTIILLNRFDLHDVATQKHLGDLLIGLFYAGLICELKLRPMLKRIESQI